MKVKELIERLERLDQDTEILTTDGDYVEKLSDPSFWDERFVEPKEDGTFRDVTDKERDRDILAIVLR